MRVYRGCLEGRTGELPRMVVRGWFVQERLWVFWTGKRGKLDVEPPLTREDRVVECVLAAV